MEGRPFSVAGIISGVGNILGFYQAGFKPIFSIDHRKFIKKGWETFENNFEGIKFSDNLQDFKEINPTVIVSSPSCAQVSLLGLKRLDRKELEHLPMEEFEFIQSLNILFERNPEFFIVEYLKRFLKHFNVTHRGINREITKQFLPFPEEYRVQIIQLNAISYGIPQIRKRLFIIFSKHKYDFIYIPPIYLSIDNKKVGDVLIELDELRKTQILLNDKEPYHSPERIEGFSKLKFGESYYGTLNNKRLRPDRFAPVITSHCSRHVHPFKNRVLNVREVATFQGFPLDFQFFGSEGIQLDLVGKSIPPPIAKHFAQSIYESLIKYENRNQ